MFKISSECGNRKRLFLLLRTFCGFSGGVCCAEFSYVIIKPNKLFSYGKESQALTEKSKKYRIKAIHIDKAD